MFQPDRIHPLASGAPDDPRQRLAGARAAAPAIAAKPARDSRRNGRPVSVGPSRPRGPPWWTAAAIGRACLFRRGHRRRRFRPAHRRGRRRLGASRGAARPAAAAERPAAAAGATFGGGSAPVGDASGRPGLGSCLRPRGGAPCAAAGGADVRGRLHRARRRTADIGRRSPPATFRRAPSIRGRNRLGRHAGRHSGTRFLAGIDRRAPARRRGASARCAAVGGAPGTGERCAEAGPHRDDRVDAGPRRSRPLAARRWGPAGLPRSRSPARATGTPAAAGAATTRPRLFGCVRAAAGPRGPERGLARGAGTAASRPRATHGRAATRPAARTSAVAGTELVDDRRAPAAGRA